MLLITSTELNNLQNQNLNAYMEQEHPDAATIFDSKTLLHQIVSCSVLSYPPDDEMPDFPDTKCFLMDKLIDYYSCHKSKNRNAVKNFEALDLLYFCDDPQMLADEEYECTQRKIELFGSVDNFNKFVNTCFEPADHIYSSSQAPDASSTASKPNAL